MTNEFEKLLEQYLGKEAEEEKFKRGQIVKGIVVAEDNNNYYVDIGYKIEALLPKEEVEREGKTLNIGDEIKAVVVKISNRLQNPKISLKALKAKRLKQLTRAVGTSRSFEAEVIKKKEKGYLVSIDGIKGFLPFKYSEKDLKVGEKIKVIVLESKQEKNRVKIILKQKDIAYKSEELSGIPDKSKKESATHYNPQKFKNLYLGKNNFLLDIQLNLKCPITLEGQGKNETFIKVKQLIIRNPNIVFKDLTLEADEVIFYEPIKKLENAAFYAKQGESFIPKEIFEGQKSEFKIDNLKTEQILISKTFDDFQLTNATLRELLKKSSNLVFEGIKIHIKEDLKIENANIEFKNCEILFYSDSGILAKGGTFKAQNSTFQMASGVESYRNITLINCKGFIDNCKFFNLKGGRNSNEINPLTGRNLYENILIGGALLIIPEKEYIYEIKNSVFENCSSQYGGAVDLKNKALIKNSIFIKCSASTSGGGIYADGYSKVENCEFENCSAKWGGGVYADDYSEVENCTFKNCTAKKHGGGIEAVSNSKILNSIFENCSAKDWGGGVHAKNVASIEHSEFRNCSANYGGGVCADDSSSVEYCIFKNCSAQKKGSGLYAEKNAYYCCNKFENCSYYKESKEDSGGCYITTATFKALKTQNDRCEELELFRWYRDNILLNEPDGKQLIEEYYKTAPLIVEKINSRPDAEEIYKHLWEDYLKVCLEELKRGNYKKVKTLYAEMVSELQKRFL